MTHANEAINLLPMPLLVNINSTEKTIIPPNTRVVANSSALPIGEEIASRLRPVSGFEWPVVPLNTKIPDGEHTIKLILDPTFTLPAEAIQKLGHTTQNDLQKYQRHQAYHLELTPQGVVATASHEAGIFYATRTLLQLFPPAVDGHNKASINWTLPTGTIWDAPRYEHRGVQLDVARNFFPVEEIKRLIRDLADFKLSVLHLHLADDQGWRLEITNEGKDPEDTIDYTQLTKISGATAIGYDPFAYRENDTDPGTTGRTGFYTQNEYQYLVEYASRHFLTIIPEIDIPGHCNAAIHAIAELNSPGSSHDGTRHNPQDPHSWDRSPHNDTAKVGYSYIDPFSAHTYRFVRHVFKQVAALTPSNLIHIGGDEVESFMERYGQNVANEFIDHIMSYLREIGKSPIGWNEISANTMREGEAVQYWKGSTTDIVRAAKEGAKVVLSKADATYLDMQYPHRDRIGLNWCTPADVDVYYQWDPATQIENIPATAVAGIEYPQWSETLRTASQSQFLMYPRLIAGAEVGWSVMAVRSWESFAKRLGAYGPRLVLRDLNFYDGPVVNWEYVIYPLAPDLAITARLKPDLNKTEAEWATVALLAAPGTRLLAPFTIGKDRVNTDVNTQWVDGEICFKVENQTIPTTATRIVESKPRDAITASGTYKLQVDLQVARQLGKAVTVQLPDGVTVEAPLA